MRADATPVHGKFAASGDPAVVNPFKSELERVSTLRDRGGAQACACRLSALFDAAGRYRGAMLALRLLMAAFVPPATLARGARMLSTCHTQRNGAFCLSDGVRRKGSGSWNETRELTEVVRQAPGRGGRPSQYLADHQTCPPKHQNVRHGRLAPSAASGGRRFIGSRARTSTFQKPPQTGCKSNWPHGEKSCEHLDRAAHWAQTFNERRQHFRPRTGRTPPAVICREAWIGRRTCPARTRGLADVGRSSKSSDTGRHCPSRLLEWDGPSRRLEFAAGLDTAWPNPRPKYRHTSNGHRQHFWPRAGLGRG